MLGYEQSQQVRLIKEKGLCLSISLFSLAATRRCIGYYRKDAYVGIWLWSKVQRPHLLMALLLAESQGGREHDTERVKEDMSDRTELVFITENPGVH